jgi:hypothetical protein
MAQIIKNNRRGLTLNKHRKKNTTPPHRREFVQICTCHKIAWTRQADNSVCPVSTSTRVGIILFKIQEPHSWRLNSEHPTNNGKRQANWIGKNCLLKHFIEGKIKGKI